MTQRTDDPNVLLRQIMDENRAPQVEGMPPFSGGLVGYFSYDYLKYKEPSLRLPKTKNPFRTLI